MRHILVLGYFGYQTNQLDGQTVKTRDLYRLVCEQSEIPVDFYDTEEFQYNKFSIFKMYWKILCCKTLIYLPAHNNLKIIFPTIFCLSLLLRIKIHYFVVGGWLREFIDDKPVHRYMLSKICGIHVETYRLKNELEEHYHFPNVDIFPNFRFFDSKIHPRPKENSDILKIVFVSRVEKSKGLDTLLEVAKIITELGLAKNLSIDFYGQKKDSYYDQNLINIDFYRYKGVLEPTNVISTLMNYDILIFPTHYDGEGCPGILVEAMAAGLPIIASDWKYNGEFVHNGQNGILCDTFDAMSYVNAMKSFFINETLYKMSQNSIASSKFYSDDNARILLKNREIL